MSSHRATEEVPEGNSRGAMSFPAPKVRPPELPRCLQRRLTCNQGAVRAVRFNVDGNYCITCGSDKSLKLWNPHKGTMLKTYSGHGYEVLDAAGSLDNSQLCSCSSDKTVILWDVAQGLMVRKFRGHAGKVNCVQFNEESTVVISGPITCVSFSQDSQCLLASSLDSSLRLLDKDTGELLGEYTGHQNKSYKLDSCLSEKDTHVVSCSEDGTVCFWDLVEGSLVLKLPVSKGVVQSLSYHPTEPCLLTSSEGEIQVWRETPHEENTAQ
ncbi:WD repeat domain-containing protein 83 isoform X3 [Pseudophryne corroboree]|uniref:WD repeat domain-containing protein 83 isoform X3 n=1 Tax=Pseudophryne corroboree TaxID=495146 RepID=UPI0030815BD0